ncbi:hypothetical protein PQR66_39345 [Paraburkholderia agricolaris]|uniref:Uncharacterized protein n=1 Tax=Paraburkholderia agricolaris TaxID=2152888 RepID=A0ABW9A2B5_9BURK
MEILQSSRREFVFKAAIGGFALLGARAAISQNPLPIIPNALPEAERLNASVKVVNNYSVLSDTLSKKTKVQPSEYEQLNRQAALAKDEVGSLKTNLQSIIEKAKSAGVWDNLDSLFAQQLQKVNADPAKKAHYLNWVKANGGARSVMEDAVGQLDTIPGQITNDVEMIRKKQVSFDFDFISPAYARIALWKCAVIAAVGIGATCAGCIACGVGAVVGMAVNC